MGNKLVNKSTASFSNSVGPSSCDKSESTGVTVSDRLASNAVSMCSSSVRNMPHRFHVSDWEAIFLLYYLQCKGCQTRVRTMSPFDQLFATGLGMVGNRIAAGLVNMNTIEEAIAKFER